MTRPDALIALPAAMKTRIKRRKDKLHGTVVETADQPLQTLDLKPATIHRHQENDAFCSRLIAYLTDGTLPDDAKEARNIVLREGDYVIINNLLYHIFTSQGPKPSTAKAQLVIPKSLQPHLLSFHHDASYAGHVGAKKMVELMRERYYWPSMVSQIWHYVATCATCHTTKKNTQPFKPPLQIQDPSPSSFHSICLDWVGPLVKQTKAHYICL